MFVKYTYGRSLTNSSTNPMRRSTNFSYLIACQNFIAQDQTQPINFFCKMQIDHQQITLINRTW